MKIRRTALLLACAAALTGALLLARHPADAGNAIDVTTIQDNENVDGNCSVREAIKAADENTVVDTCDGTSANMIQLPGSVIKVSNPLRPKSDMTIQGQAGSGIDGQSFDRVFIISDSTLDFTVTLKDFQIQKGRTVAGGAGINNGEELTLDNMTMTANEAIAAGGAISNSPSGNLTVLNSTIAGNFSRSGSGGSGIYNGGTLVVRDSAIRDNGDPALGANGGGFANLGTMTLERVLIADNTADTTVDPVDDGNGGGIYNSGTALILNSTISGNTAANGGAIFNEEGGATVTLEFVTIANNTGLPDSGSPQDTDGIHNLSSVNVRSTIIANGAGAENCNVANLASNGGNVENANTCGLNAAGDKVSTDPQIASIAANGGATETHALLEGSPAVDAGVGKCPSVDQRGEPRPQGNGCDAGAFESSFTGPTPAPTPEPTPAPTGVPKNVAMGDVDCDLDVDSVDGLKALRHVASLSVAQNPGCPAIGTEVASLFGDVDCDGDIDSVDSLKVLRNIAGLSVAQTEPCTDIGLPLAP